MLIKCVPDDDGCIDLGSVMQIMSQIDQEQAWALAYQLAALMQRLWPAGNNCATIQSLAQIYINQEGWVHEKSLQLAASRRRSRSEESSPTITDEADDDELVAMQRSSHKAQPSPVSRAVTAASGQQQQQQQATKQPESTTERLTTQSQKLPPTPPISPELHEQLLRRQRAASEQELVSSLGIALFRALDYGIPEDEERKLSRAMEFLIVESQKGLTLAELQEICIERLPTPTKVAAEQHYRGVCKALIADTIELSVLLDKIYTATMVMNGAGAAPAAHGLQTTSQQQQTSATNNSINSNNNNTSDMMSHHQATNYLQLSERHTTQADYLHHHLMHTIDQEELSELGLPLASLRALKINEWARLWMQVIRELRQKRRFQQHQQRHQYDNEHVPNDVLQAV